MKIASRLASVAVVVACALSVHAGSLPQLPVSGGGQSFGFGSTSGSFNVPMVPTQSGDGFAGGILNLGQGFPFFAMSLTLPADETIVLQGGRLSGTLHGGLFSFPLAPFAEPDYDVSGTWNWDPATGTGRFTGYITTGGLLGQPPFAPTILVGVIGGRIEDPATPFGPDILGSYAGRWRFF